MPPSLKTVQNLLPAFHGIKEKVTNRQDTNDIIDVIQYSHGLFEKDYDKIANIFDTGNIDSTARGLWEFLKYNLTYDAETGKDQTSKSPSYILHEGEKIDCKHYSLFIAGVLDAIKRKNDVPWDWTYRFVSYNTSPIPGHVFVVVNQGKSEIWIDPVLSSYNQKKEYQYYIDEKPMALYIMSGPGDPIETEHPTIDVNPEIAWSSFLTMINFNMFSLKDLLLSNPQIVNTQLKNWCAGNSYDFNQLINFLNAR